MSKSNPTKAIRALPQAIQCSGGVEVLPLSLAHYALLESGLVFVGDASRRTVKSIHLDDSKIVHRNMDVLEELAISWASELPVSVSDELKNAVLRQFANLIDVLPETSEGKKKWSQWLGCFAG